MWFQVNELFQDTQRSLDETNQQLSVTSDHLATTREHLARTAQELHVTKQEKDENEFLVSEHIRSEQNLLGEAETVSRVCVCVWGGGGGLRLSN